MKAPAVIRIRLWAEVALLSVMAMEATWLSAYYNALSRDQVSLAALIPILTGILIVSHYLARGMAFFHARLRTRRILMVTWALAALFGSLWLLVFHAQPVSLGTLILHPFQIRASDESASFAQYGHLLLVGLLVRRGVGLARQPVTALQAQRSFLLGILFLLGYGFLFAWLEQELKSYFLLFFFLFFGITGITAARIAGITLLRGGRANPFSRPWVITLLAAVLVSLGLALLIGVGARGILGLAVERLTYLALAAVTALLFLVIYPLIWLMARLAPALERLFAGIPPLRIFEDLLNLLNGFAERQVEEVTRLSGALVTVRVLGRVALVAVILAAVLLALQWKPFARRREQEEITEAAGGQARPSLPGLRLGGGGNPLRRVARWLAAARIRQIYADLMALCARVGLPRGNADTPLEFLPKMQALFPENASELAQITDAYQRVRYGELPESVAETRSAAQALAAVQRAARGM